MRLDQIDEDREYDWTSDDFWDARIVFAIGSQCIEDGGCNEVGM